MNDKIFLQINNLKELFYVIWYNRLISYWNWIEEFQNNNYEKYKLYLKYSKLKQKHKSFAKLFSFLEWVLISKWDRDDSSFYYKLQEDNPFKIKKTFFSGYSLIFAKCQLYHSLYTVLQRSSSNCTFYQWLLGQGIEDNDINLFYYFLELLVDYLSLHFLYTQFFELKKHFFL